MKPSGSSTHRSPARFIARMLPGGRVAAYPGFVTPAAATAGACPRTKNWLHEVKQRGERAQLHLLNGAPRIFQRDGEDASRAYAPLIEAARRLPANKLILDGVVTPATTMRPLRYNAFDILYLDGFDICDAPLIERKRVLAMLLDGANDVFAPFDFTRDPSTLPPTARLRIAKQCSASYRDGEASGWIAWRKRER